MVSSSTDLQEIARIAPEWQGAIRAALQQGSLRLHDVLAEIGARELYRKALSLDADRRVLVGILRESYLQPMTAKMLSSNIALKRFWGQRRVDASEQKQQALSLSVDLSSKLEVALTKQLASGAEDGFKVLLPAYVQRSVHNAVVDYIRHEWSWERQTLQDINLDPEKEDPRHSVAEDIAYAPEQQALAAEQVGQLNELRRHIKSMLADPTLAREPLVVIDCLFGLGLTESSRLGEDMTMREVTEVLSIAGETQARRIARCQVLMDKGMDMIRQRIREKLPGLVEAWQTSINVNSASRRELTQQLGLTEGEIERLIAKRQFMRLEELVEQACIKAHRLGDIAERGAVAAFVPVDLNAATVRDMIDITGLPKDLAQTIASKRPFADLAGLAATLKIGESDIKTYVARGAVVRAPASAKARVDLNAAPVADLVACGLESGIAHRISRGRPFATWSELEDYLVPDSATWALLRQKFCLGLGSG